MEQEKEDAEFKTCEAVKVGNPKAELWRKAEMNEWYRWTMYTTREQTDEECIVCAGAHPRLMIIPHPYKSKDCNLIYNASYTDDLNLDEVPCPFWCLMGAGQYEPVL